MQYFLKKIAKTLDKHVLIVVSLRHKTNTNKKNKNNFVCSSDIRVALLFYIESVRMRAGYKPER